ncbi:MAG: HsdR family type I site-specific deoxyribonuclease, partial [Streptococcaceae bacterium]|nr:HsdR family type I site-specific deoxyribonuclease [Streptococcaceae bacterium]
MQETTETAPILESNHFIILDKYNKLEQEGNFQTESDLEREFIKDLQHQGYEYLNYLTTPEALLENLRIQVQMLNAVTFSDAEWARILTEYINKPSDGIIERTRKIHDDFVCDFIFDDGHIQNIYLLDKKNVARNKLQVINQMKQAGTQANRYDVTVLVNGLPLVQIELKKRGVSIREAFNQIHRYSKESFNSENSLFKYLQLFVISNGTDTRYFANTTKRDKNSFDFTMNWALKDNEPIKDLKDFTATFFCKNTLLNVLINYSVFDTNDTLLIMRPYQIAAAERILWKIKSAHTAKLKSGPETGGYIWHTTGSGKTLTSFKAARLATELDFIDKVFFVVDRKDLDYQTMKEYQRFSPDSVNGSESTAGLKRNIEKADNKIIVTTIQKLNNLMKSKDMDGHEIYSKQVVFIFDECHRSQFGEAQRNLKKKFKHYYQFGFTGTPIFVENALGSETTASVFGAELHSYVITDAIRDQKVLKFMVDYNDVRPQFARLEAETDAQKLSAAENRQALLHPTRINEISEYILNHFSQKTHRNAGKGFNAMFAVSSVEAAKLYYEALQKLQASAEKKLTIATIFSFAANEEQNALGDIADENFEPTA